MPIQKRFIVLTILLSTIFIFNATAETVSLDYKNFCNMLDKDKIASFTIYTHYDSEIDATATDVEGQLYVVERPYRYQEDDIFLAHLESKGISPAILNQVYSGELPADHGERFGFMIFGWIFWLIPLAIIIVNMMQSRTISRQAKIIEKLINKNNVETESPTIST